VLTTTPPSICVVAACVNLKPLNSFGIYSVHSATAINSVGDVSRAFLHRETAACCGAEACQVFTGKNGYFHVAGGAGKIYWDMAPPLGYVAHMFAVRATVLTFFILTLADCFDTDRRNGQIGQ